MERVLSFIAKTLIPFNSYILSHPLMFRLPSTAAFRYRVKNTGPFFYLSMVSSFNCLILNLANTICFLPQSQTFSLSLTL